MISAKVRLRFFILAAAVSFALSVSTTAVPQVQLACGNLSEHVRMCYPGLGWQKVPAQGNANVQYRGPDGYHAMVVIEKAGTARGLTIEAAENAVIANARAVSEGAFEVLVRGRTGGRHNSTILVFHANTKGIPIINANTIKLGQHELVQVVTWRVGVELTQQDQDIHRKFGRSIELLRGF